MPFETLPSGFDVTGLSATVFEVGGIAPTNVIRTTENWRVHIHFDTSNLLSQFLPGFWQVEAYVDALGPGADIEVGQKNVPLTPGPGTIPYDVDIDVPAGTVMPAPGEASVLAKLVLAVTYQWPGHTPGPMAGFIEGPILQFYIP